MIRLFHRLYQRRAWDFSEIALPAHRNILQGALDACDFNFYRIRKNTGKRVPCTVSDLSKFNMSLDANGAHGHVHDEESGRHGHLLGLPNAFQPALKAEFRHQALGLFWLPTSGEPAGSVEVDVGCFEDPKLAREVFLAEAAHAVDYGAISPEQRLAIMALFEHTGPDAPEAGWFEELGEEDYWAWRGERWMGLFMAAYAPALPKVLEPRQPWHWSYDASDTAAVRHILG